jgi:uncharacterized tellurite resistance protein B-like protein
MTSDGKIDKKEIENIKSKLENSDLFDNLNVEEEFNGLINDINLKGKDFIKGYFEELNTANLEENQELMIIDLAIETIHSDGIDDYSEIKFFKNIRHRLKVSDEKILLNHPEVEYWLEDDIVAENLLDKITAQYLDLAEIPHFEFINFKPS